MRNALSSFLVLLALSSSLIAQPAQRNVPEESDRPRIDVESYNLQITLAPEEHRLDGIAEIRFNRLDRQSFATFDLDRRLRVTKVTVGDEEVRFRQFDLDSTLEL